MLQYISMLIPVVFMSGLAFAHSDMLKHTLFTSTLLMDNYQEVVAFRALTLGHSFPVLRVLSLQILTRLFHVWNDKNSFSQDFCLNGLIPWPQSKRYTSQFRSWTRGKHIQNTAQTWKHGRGEGVWTQWHVSSSSHCICVLTWPQPSNRICFLTLRGT